LVQIQLRPPIDQPQRGYGNTIRLRWETLREVLREQKERYQTEIETLEALSEDDLRKHYSPKQVQPVSQQPGFDPAIDPVLSNGAKAPAGFVPGRMMRGPDSA
jgi:hypothetical protein